MFKFTIIVSSVLLQDSLIQLIQNASHAQLIILTAALQEDVSALNALSQDSWIQSRTNVNVKLWKEFKWFIKKIQTNVFAQQICHFGMVDIVWLAHQVQSMIQRKDNAITAHKVLLEIEAAMLVCQDFEGCNDL